MPDDRAFTCMAIEQSNHNPKLPGIKERQDMPAYDYKCQDCQNTITIIRSISDDEQTPICAHCAKEMTRSYDSAPLVTFKGNGFYKTDK